MPIQKFNTGEILSEYEHRPWPLPVAPWKYYQEWNDALFLHWKVDIAVLRDFVPDELVIDLFQGNAWVSLVAFTMERIRLRNFIAYKPVSNFHEINIRTYVKRNGKQGVYFLSIEAGNHISCCVARALSGLPYRYSSIRRDGTGYFSENRIFKDRLQIQYETGDQFSKKSPLDKWLTERYALFHEKQGCINEYEIHHREWPVHALQLILLESGYPRFAQLFSGRPDVTHYSPGVQVVAWGKKKSDR